ncbi:M10 family metallopeptidase C-terminal domain-containing protein, partial [Ensifer aridi]|uniref:M10 family metallopeptidase C-terminal domain-containing protein n=1 Tax=Ensifer aridi TaxID=1708715 RepID=UPI0015E30F4A
NVKGGSAADSITGNQAANTLWGYGGNDVLNGDSGNDALYGSDGRDKIRGGDGNDRILGGSGRDYLSGATGADTFVYKTPSESTVASTGRDTIYGFLPSEADRIDLSAIDANAMTRTNNGFAFLGGKEFRGNAGELRYVKEATDTYIYADINGDKKADISIHLDVAIIMEKGFFVL